MTITILDKRTHAQEEILITLRALAGLVAEALWLTATSDDTATFARDSARLSFWQGFQMCHTRRLLPTVVGDVDESACRAFATQLVREIYRDEHGAESDYGQIADASRRWSIDSIAADLIDSMREGM